MDMKKLSDKSSYLDVLLEEAREEVGYADHKASLILAALGIGFSVVLGGLFASDWDPTKLSGFVETLWWVATGVAVYAVFAAASAVWPRLGDSSRRDELYYWGQVAQYDTADAFAKAVDGLSPDPEKRTADQVWQLSGIVKTKYDWIRHAMAAAGLSMALLLIVGLIELVAS